MLLTNQQDSSRIRIFLSLTTEPLKSPGDARATQRSAEISRWATHRQKTMGTQCPLMQSMGTLSPCVSFPLCRACSRADVSLALSHRSRSDVWNTTQIPANL